MRIDADDLERACQGRWAAIFERLGVDVGHGEHKCCPACSPGEPTSDRFRFDNKNNSGSYYCNGCGAGLGLSLVRKVFGLSFPDTLKKVADAIGYIPPDKNKPFVPAKDPAIRLNELWKSSKPLKNGDPVMLYLNSRGIKEIPLDVRFCPECWEPDTKRNYFAMVAMVRDVSGKPVSLHRTYLNGKGGKADIEKPKKLMTGKKNISGCAVWLFKAGSSVGVAEGIETALSVYVLHNIPCWATISTSGMMSFEPPAGVDVVDIFPDKDENYAGYKAGFALAHKLKMKGTGVCLYFPARQGDFNDELMRGSHKRWSK